MRLTALVLGAAFCLAALPASAQISVIGGGLARDCFEAAKFQRLSASDGEKLCTRAIEQEAMKLSNRTATYTNRGVLRMRQGRLDASLTDFGVAKKMDPSIGSIYLNEGAALISEGRPRRRARRPRTGDCAQFRRAARGPLQPGHRPRADRRCAGRL